MPAPSEVGDVHGHHHDLFELTDENRADLLCLDAVLAYDRDGFFDGVLEAMRRRMVALGSTRVWLEGGWYWVLQPNAAWGEPIEI
jgi:hypothetical protein